MTEETNQKLTEISKNYLQVGSPAVVSTGSAKVSEYAERLLKMKPKQVLGEVKRASKDPKARLIDQAWASAMLIAVFKTSPYVNDPYMAKRKNQNKNGFMIGGSRIKEAK